MSLDGNFTELKMLDKKVARKTFFGLDEFLSISTSSPFLLQSYKAASRARDLTTNSMEVIPAKEANALMPARRDDFVRKTPSRANFISLT